MVVLLLVECVLLPDSPGLQKDQGLAQTQKDSDVILKWEVGWWRILYH